MGLKRLISKLDSGGTFGESFPNHNTFSNVGGFNYGESLSIFDANTPDNSYFPFKQRSMGYGPQGIKDDTGVFGRLHGPTPIGQKARKLLGLEHNLPDLDPDKLGPGDTGPILGLGGAIDSITDVGVRGGLVTALKRSAIDAARIGEFLISAKGIGFIAKNVGLQLTNPKLQEGKETSFLGMNLGSNNRIYNLGINTLAQTLTAASGLHVNRAGLLPIGPKNYEVEPGFGIDSNNKSKYEYNVRGGGPNQEGGSGNNTGGINVYSSNRLTALYNNLLNPFSNLLEGGGNSDVGTDLEFDKDGKLSGVVYGDDPFTNEEEGGNFDGNPMNNPDLYSFKGGPHSVYGIGKTTLKRYVFTNRDVYFAEKEINEQEDGYLYSRHKGHRLGSKIMSHTREIDFRKSRGIPYTNYDLRTESGQYLDEVYGHARGVHRSTPMNKNGTVNVRSTTPKRDKINSTDIWTHEGPWDTTDLGSKVKDFIKFRIEAVNTDKPTESDTMVFRAYLDSMDDNYSSKWNEYNYNGRAEPFYTFSSFNRSISFSFKVAAFSRADMRPMYRKLNYLVSQTAGEYSNTRLRGNFCRLTMGDYHSRLPGFFTGISVKWNKEYPWEIAMYQENLKQTAQTSGLFHGDQNKSPQFAANSLEDINISNDLKKRKQAALDKEYTDSLPPAEFQGSYQDGVSVRHAELAEVKIVDQGETQPMDSDMLELPHILDVSCTFQPVHDFLPSKGGNITTRDSLGSGVISTETITEKRMSPFIIPNQHNRAGLTGANDWLNYTKGDLRGYSGTIQEDKVQAFKDQAAADEEENERLNALEREKEEQRKREEFEKAGVKVVND
tara:strand:+ start:1203 stop:3701 length:2499 start_codon:yes stop_codon:yes gene_type:complete